MDVATTLLRKKQGALFTMELATITYIFLKQLVLCNFCVRDVKVLARKYSCVISVLPTRIISHDWFTIPDTLAITQILRKEFPNDIFSPCNFVCL